MSFILKKYTVECSELGDSSETIAISNDKDKLIEYCKNVLNSKINDRTKPYDSYYKIHNSNINII